MVALVFLVVVVLRQVGCCKNQGQCTSALDQPHATCK
jgi:hypothetical protein